jgi:hypothetical protein
MLQLLDIFINNIAPILLIAGIGFIAGRRLEIDAKSLGKLVFNILSPSLIFYSLSHSTVSALEFAQLALTVVVYTAILTFVSLSIIRLRNGDRVERVSTLLCAITANNGNYGLPLLALAFSESVLARGIMVTVIMSSLTYTLGIFIASSGRQNPREALLKVTRIPMVYAALSGLAVNLLGITLPTPLDRSLNLLSQGTFPAMLLILGLQLSQVRITRFAPIALSVGLRMLIAPLIILLIALLFALPPEAFIAVMTQASMPVAVVTTVFAMEFELDRELISGSVMLSTLLSPVTLSLIILVLQQTFTTVGN